MMTGWEKRIQNPKTQKNPNPKILPTVYRIIQSIDNQLEQDIQLIHWKEPLKAL